MFISPPSATLYAVAHFSCTIQSSLLKGPFLVCAGFQIISSRILFGRGFVTCCRVVHLNFYFLSRIGFQAFLFFHFAPSRSSWCLLIGCFLSLFAKSGVRPPIAWPDLWTHFAPVRVHGYGPGERSLFGAFFLVRPPSTHSPVYCGRLTTQPIKFEYELCVTSTKACPSLSQSSEGRP